MSQDAQAVLEAVFQACPDALLVVDVEGTITQANPACAELLGYSTAELRGLLLEQLVPEQARGAHARNRRYYAAEPMVRPMGGGRPIRAVRRGGSEVPVDVRLAPVTGGAVVVSLHDRREREGLKEALRVRERQLQMAQAQLASAAATDPVTGARNRAAFREDLARKVALSLRNGQPLSLVLMDLDGFAAFNDEFGPEHGDETLKRVAGLVRYTARRSDLLSRTGADVFTLVLPETDAEGGTCCAQRVRAALHEAQWGYRPITASFGVATLAGGDRSGKQPPVEQVRDRLRAQAEQALRVAKDRGRDRAVHARDL